MKRISMRGYAIKSVVVAIVIAAVLMAVYFIASNKETLRNDEMTSGDLNIEDEVGAEPPGEGTYHCLSIRQLLYVAELVRVENGRITGLKSEKLIDRLMRQNKYTKAASRFSDRDGQHISYAYRCSIDSDGAMTDERNDEASMVTVYCGGQPQSAPFVSIIVKKREIYGQLLMQTYALNYYKVDGGAFHKEGSRYSIFPTKLLDDNGYEVDIYRD